MKKNIDVIICTNKNLTVLKKLIRQIFSQKGNFFIKIIIIHQTHLASLFPNFLNNKNIVYRNIKKQNLSVAKNTGLEIANSNNICFLDDDVSIKNNYFYDCINFSQKKKCDLIFNKIIQQKTLKPLSKNMRNHDIKINFLNSSCCLSSSMWIFLKNKNKIFFDEKFGLGAKYGSGEETDYIFNNLKKKNSIYYLSKASIYHPEEFSDQKNLTQVYDKFYSYGTGQGALLKKNIDISTIKINYLFIISLFRSFVAILIYIIFFDKNNIIKYYSLLKGKIFGFLNYN